MQPPAQVQNAELPAERQRLELRRRAMDAARSVGLAPPQPAITPRSTRVQVQGPRGTCEITGGSVRDVEPAARVRSRDRKRGRVRNGNGSDSSAARQPRRARKPGALAVAMQFDATCGEALVTTHDRDAEYFRSGLQARDGHSEHALPTGLGRLTGMMSSPSQYTAVVKDEGGTLDATPRGDCGQGGTYSDGSDVDAETCGGFGNGDRGAAGLPCGVDAALHSGHSEGGNFDVAPYGNCNERDFDFGNNGDYSKNGDFGNSGDYSENSDFGNSGDYSADGGFDDTARPAAGDRDVEFGERHVHYADGHLDVEAGAFQDARGCSTGDDERGACAVADAECREAAAHYADERDGARGWSSTDEGGEDFCVDARDDAREWSGTDAGGEDFCDDERDDAREWSGTDEGGDEFYDSDAGFGDARW